MTDQNKNPAQEPLASVYTESFAEVLKQTGLSLLVSTYQAGKLIVLREQNGGINSHFRNFSVPMGIAVEERRVAVGGSSELWVYQNLPAVADKISGEYQHDAVYLPRSMHVTGKIDIHEMAWVGDEVWFVNTAFSCLCTPASDASFVPRWQPPFVSAISPEDRCHLNGLALRDGKPRYVTGLGQTDSQAGWREHKKDGGFVMDIETNEILAEGLCMPHSPRWHKGRLWLLNSGEGALGYIDDGAFRKVMSLPGFVRGFSLHDEIAFVGLSFVRESAAFSGIPLTLDEEAEQYCGVWIVHLERAEVLGFVRFESGVREIFSVEILPARYPELVEFGNELIGTSFALPPEAIEKVPDDLKT